MKEKIIRCFNSYLSESPYCGKTFHSLKSMKAHWRCNHHESYKEFHEETLPELLKKKV